MQVSTRDFGLVTVEPENIIEFQQPMFGFENFKNYILLYDEEIGQHFTWLQSVEDPGLCFLLADPDLIHPKYKEEVHPYIPPVLEAGDCECWTVLAVPDNFSKATVNLKSPVLINTHNHQAAQIILDGDYPIRCPLKKEEPSHADAVEKNQ